MPQRQLDPDAAEALAGVLPPLPIGDLTPDRARADYDATPKPEGDPLASVIDDSVRADDGTEIPVRRYLDREPTATDLSPVVVFFHGGGWVLSHIDGHDAFARRIAKLTGALVVSVGYRLAPEHPFPAAMDDSWAVTKWLADHAVEWGGDGERLAVCGDSAGGNLAAAVALRARDETLDLKYQALIYPCVDTEQDRYESNEQNGTGYFLTAAKMAWFWDQYVRPEHRDLPYAVPARSTDLAGVAPALVQTTEFDPLRDEGEAYAARLLAAGVDTTVTRYPGVGHGFATRPHLFSRAAAAQDELAQHLQRALETAPQSSGN